MWFRASGPCLSAVLTVRNARLQETPTGRAVRLSSVHDAPELHLAEALECFVASDASAVVEHTKQCAFSSAAQVASATRRMLQPEIVHLCPAENHANDPVAVAASCCSSTCSCSFRMM